MATLLAKITSLASRGKGFVGGSGTQIGELLVDGVLFESITRSARPTRHPLAQSVGLNNQQIVADHVINNPIIYRCEGFITDTPQNLIGSVKSIIELASGDVLQGIKDRFDGKGQKQNLAVEVLRAAADNNILVDVVAYRESFTNMLITNLDFQDEADGLQRLFFKATLEKLLIIEPSITSGLAPLSQFSNIVAGKSNFGNQVARAANAAELDKASSVVKLARRFT